MNSPLLELKQISVSFEGFLALRDLDLVLNQGDLRAVIGPNGAGKTTFLDVITGKVAPTKGDVIFKEKSLNRISLRIIITFLSRFKFPYFIFFVVFSRVVVH